MPISIRRVGATTILPLRHRVLRPGMPIEAAMDDRDDGPEAAHFAAFDTGAADDAAAGTADTVAGTAAAAGERLVGCVTIYPDPLDGSPAWRLRGMAVADGVRGGGVGRKLVDAVHWHVDASPLPKRLWCNARVPAIGFYERCGWQSVSDVFDIPTVGPHRVMVRRT